MVKKAAMSAIVFLPVVRIFRELLVQAETRNCVYLVSGWIFFM